MWQRTEESQDDQHGEKTVRAGHAARLQKEGIGSKKKRNQIEQNCPDTTCSQELSKILGDTSARVGSLARKSSVPMLKGWCASSRQDRRISLVIDHPSRS